MKKIVVLAMVLAVGVAFKVFAADEMVHVANKICPVSHEAVGQNGMKPQEVTFKGKVYNLCCGMCVKDFNKDPEKYVKIMEDEVAADSKKM